MLNIIKDRRTFTVHTERTDFNVQIDLVKNSRNKYLVVVSMPDGEKVDIHTCDGYAEAEVQAEAMIDDEIDQLQEKFGDDQD